MLTKSEIKNEPVLGCFMDISLSQYVSIKRDFEIKLRDQAILAIDLQAEVDRLKAERRWIPVSEPPSDDRPVLLTDGLDIYSGFYRNGNWHELNGYVLDGITHYQEQMPLPQPPEGSEK